ncbi:MAG: hypothetical protein ACRDJP_10230 [Actinomycetota bacterium]
MVVGTALQLVRQSGVPAVDTMWAEDGNIFLTGALSESFPAPLAEPYAGYVHVLPRLLAEIVSLLPLTWASIAFSVLAAMIVAGLSLFVFHASRALLDSWLARAAVAAFVVTPPPGGWEATANVTNLQWHLLVPCFWALIATPTSVGGAVVASAVVIVTGLSAPISLVLLPIAVWRLIRRPPRAEAVVSLLFCAAGLVQLLISLSQGVPDPTETHLVDVAPIFGLRVAAGAVLGDPRLVELWPRLGWSLGIGGGVLFGILALVGAMQGGRRRTITLLMLGASGLLFAVPVYLRGTSLMLPFSDRLFLTGSKWVVGPLLLVTTALIALADRPPGRLLAVRRPLALVIAAVLGTAIATSFRVVNPRSHGPTWSAGIARAGARCAEGGLAEVTIPIPPPTFDARVPCARLDRPRWTALLRSR